MKKLRSVVVALGVAVMVALGSSPASAVKAPKAPAVVVKGSAGLMGLSFDDGPDPIRTPLVLAQLAAKGEKATFFLLGKQVKKYPQIAKLIVQQGHTIGNHGWDHTDFSDVDENPDNGLIPLTYEQAKKQIVDTNNEIKKATGQTPILFRYPHGNESPEGNRVIRELGMWGGVLWHWSANPVLPKSKIFTGDWDCKMTASDIDAYIQANAVNQAIILLHDGTDGGSCNISHYGYVTTAITALKAKGFDFGTIEIAYEPSTVNGQSWVKVAKLVPDGV